MLEHLAAPPDDADLPAVIAHDPLHDHQAEPVAANLSRVIRLKQADQILLLDARTRVTEQEINVFVVHPRPDP